MHYYIIANLVFVSWEADGPDFPLFKWNKPLFMYLKVFSALACCEVVCANFLLAFLLMDTLMVCRLTYGSVVWIPSKHLSYLYTLILWSVHFLPSLYFVLQRSDKIYRKAWRKLRSFDEVYVIYIDMVVCDLVSRSLLFKIKFRRCRVCLSLFSLSIN